MLSNDDMFHSAFATKQLITYAGGAVRALKQLYKIVDRQSRILTDRK